MDHRRLVGVSSVRNGIAAASSHALAADLLRGGMRNRREIAAPDQSARDAVLSIHNRQHLAVTAGLHPQRAQQVRFGCERFVAAAFAASHQAHKNLTADFTDPTDFH